MALNNKTRNILIIVSIVAMLLLFYIAGRSSSKIKVLGSTTGSTPGFDGYSQASDIANAFFSGWFGDAGAKKKALQRLYSLSNPDLIVVYNSFGINFSKKFSGKSMKQVIEDEWITWAFEENLQDTIVGRLTSLNLT